MASVTGEETTWLLQAPFRCKVTEGFVAPANSSIRCYRSYEALQPALVFIVTLGLLDLPVLDNPQAVRGLPDSISDSPQTTLN